MRLYSWNVNGIRAIVKKDFFTDIEKLSPDVLCIQETKAQDEQVAEALSSIKGYQLYTCSAEKKGYSGTAVLTKHQPLSVQNGINIDMHDTEGRVQCLEFDKFFIVNVYVPNSGSDLKRIDYRQQWDKDFCAYLKELENGKPVVVCGDFNVAHTEIDLARPKQNYNKSAGFMQQEIDGMNRYIAENFADTFRYLFPEKTGAYSWWSYRAGARPKNIGWRIDYFLVSSEILPWVKNAGIHNNIMGSDHCPVSIELLVS